MEVTPEFITSKIFWVNLWQLYYRQYSCQVMYINVAVLSFSISLLQPTRQYYIFSVKLIWQQWTISPSWAMFVVYIAVGLLFPVRRVGDYTVNSPPLLKNPGYGPVSRRFPGHI